MSKFNAQDLAAVMYGLARLQYTPRQPWLAAALARFRACYGRSCWAPSLPKFLFGAVKLQVSEVTLQAW